MKQIIAILLCLALSLVWTGCSPAGNTADTTTPAAPSDPPEVTKQSMHSISILPVAENTEAEDGIVLFTRTYQTIRVSASQPNVALTIEADLNSRIQTALSYSSQLEVLSRSEYNGQADWHPYFMDIRYTPTRVDSTVISLFGNHSSHSGGNHPTLSTQSVNYDLRSGRALSIEDILVSDTDTAKLSDLVNWQLSLSEANLWYDYETTVAELFAGKDGPVTNWYFSQSGLCFHFAPFMIGPYSSGTIIATIPYEKLSGVMQDRFLPQTPAQSSGSIYVRSFDAGTDAPSVMLELDTEGTAALLYCDDTVYNVRIETGTWSRDGQRFVPAATVFSADKMEISDTVALRADLTDTDTALQLVYSSDSQQVTAFIRLDAEGNTVVLSK